MRKVKVIVIGFLYVIIDKIAAKPRDGGMFL